MMHALVAALLIGAASPDYPALMKSMRIPGMVVVVVQNGKVVSDTPYGVKNLDTQVPVDVHTRFEIGSITKQFTAAAILQLRERGKLSLDDKLGKYVPQYVQGRNVTLRQMLLQISGIPNYTDVKQFGAMIVKRGGTYVLSRPGTLDGVVALIDGKKLDFKPGTKWEYSNSNYYLLGRVVEIASGMPWDRYVAANIFKPAGMTESAFMENEARTPDMATGYTSDKKGIYPTGSFFGWAGGAGTIVSTASDMAKWDLALLGGKIITPSDRALMMTGGALPALGKAHYGFGWVVDTFDDQPRIWHNGGTLGFNSSNQYYPADKQIVIVLANGSGADDVADAQFDALHPDLAAAKAKAAAHEDVAVTTRIKTVYQELSSGAVDRTQFTDQANKAFTDALLAQAKAGLSQLGAPTSWVFKGKTSRESMTTYKYYVTFASGTNLYLYMTVMDESKKIAAFQFLRN